MVTFMKAMKTLFIWLLLTLIPLQGLAANAVLTCKAANQGAKLLHVAVVDDTHSHPCAGFDRALQAPAQPDGSHDGGQESDQDGYAGCVANYVSVSWLHPAELALPSITSLSAPVSFATFHLPFFIPDGPERPPRSLFL